MASEPPFPQSGNVDVNAVDPTLTRFVDACDPPSCRLASNRGRRYFYPMETNCSVSAKDPSHVSRPFRSERFFPRTNVNPEGGPRIEWRGRFCNVNPLVLGYLNVRVYLDYLQFQWLMLVFLLDIPAA